MQQRKKAVDFLSNERSQSIPMFSGDGVNLIDSVPVENLTLAEAKALIGTIDAVLGAEAFLQSIIDANTKANYGAPIDIKSALETLRKKLPTWWDD